MLTIAGSDSGGGAGIQADLKTFASLNVLGVSAITCLTAQNPRQISAINPTSAEAVSLQIESVCDFFPVVAVKIGMLYTAKIVVAVAEAIKRGKFPIVVIDPVYKATSGKLLLAKNAFKPLCSRLLPQASVITPNVPEAEMILGRHIENYADQRKAAQDISRRFKSACIIKGGHLPGNEIVDVLCCHDRLYSFRTRRLKASLHGSGCVYSAALTAYLAHGVSLKIAARLAKNYIFKLIKKNILT